MGDTMFVNREQELEVLRRLFDARLKGSSFHVLVYGLRRVGKTALIDEFLRDKRGFRVDCSYVSHGTDLFRAMFHEILSLEGEGFPVRPNELRSPALRKYYPYFERPLEDSLEMLRQAFFLINEYAREVDHLVVALDEFHGLVENISLLTPGAPAEVLRSRVLWMVRDALQRSPSNMFWILCTSAGFLMEEYGRADSAFLEMFQKLEVGPLPERASAELVRANLSNMGVSFSEDAVLEISRISGGIPAIINEITAALATEREISGTVVRKRVRELLERGEFDDFFEAYISFIADWSKWSKQTILKVLRCIAEGKTTPKEIARVSGMKPSTVANMLVDLKKKHVITESKEIRYPLLREWLLARPHPPFGIPRRELLMMHLGITFESYCRELFQRIKETVSIEDEDKMFLGTRQRLEIPPVVEVKSGEDADILVITEKGVLVIEVKSGVISKRDVEKLDEKADKYGNVISKIIIAMRGALPSAIAECIKRKITILTADAINALAGKVRMPKLPRIKP